MALQTMTYGMFKERIGDAVELRQAPGLLDLSPAEVGALVRRKKLPVHTFRTPDGVMIRMVRRSDLRALRASMRRRPELCDVIEAFKVMAAQP